MNITTLGAGRTVTGSAHLVETAGKRVLLDFGLYQGRRDESRMLNEQIPEEIRSVDAVVLSHGHLDHCGRLPLLVKAGFRGKIYATAATMDVTRVVLEDSAHIQEEDATYLKRRGSSAVKPLYTSRDVAAVLGRMVAVKYGEGVEITPGLTATIYDAGHVLGSGYVILEYEEERCRKTLLFTGDIGRPGSAILRDAHEVPFAVDHVITESTYGTVKHAPIGAVGPGMVEAVKAVTGAGGRVIFPAFAVGRTQTLLYYLIGAMRRKELGRVQIFVDSPMGVEMSRVTEAHRDLFDAEALKAAGGGKLFDEEFVRLCVTREESMAINEHRGGCVIIASSPTCEFGRVLHHLKRSVENPKDMVLFNGYTPGNTLGRKLQDGARQVRILDRMYERRCQVRTTHGLSAHADGDELLRFLAPTIRPETTATVVHGETERVDGFAARLIQAGMTTAVAPAMGTHVIFGQPWCDLGPAGVQDDGRVGAVDE
jgi:metallo-beta-lactamase family protein